jgi:hypothetical protein
MRAHSEHLRELVLKDDAAAVDNHHLIVAVTGQKGGDVAQAQDSHVAVPPALPRQHAPAAQELPLGRSQAVVDNCDIDTAAIDHPFQGCEPLPREEIAAIRVAHRDHQVLSRPLGLRGYCHFAFTLSDLPKLPNLWLRCAGAPATSHHSAPAGARREGARRQQFSDMLGPIGTRHAGRSADTAHPVPPWGVIYVGLLIQ